MSDRSNRFQWSPGELQVIDKPKPKVMFGSGRVLTFEYNPDEPRDEHGKWGLGGGGKDFNSAEDGQRYGEQLAAGNKLSATEDASLETFATEAYQPINAVLRGTEDTLGQTAGKNWAENSYGTTSESEALANAQMDIGIMDVSMARESSALPEEVQMSRVVGLNGFPRIYQSGDRLAKLEGKEFANPAFMSTVLGNPSNNGFYGGEPEQTAVMHITAPAGTRAIYMGNRASWVEPNEMVVDRGAFMRATKVEKVDGQWHVHVTITSTNATRSATK